MNCNKCGTANDDGSKFCRECGSKLPVQTTRRMLSTDEHLKVGEFVYLAYRESEAGHLDQAIEACSGALAINDANAAIHALLGSLYERKGDLARAIFEYERAVSLNPGSLDDRRKLEQLRMQLLAPIHVASPPAAPRIKVTRIKWPADLKPILPWIAAGIVFAIVVTTASSVFLHGSAKKPDSTGVGTPGRTTPAPGPNDGYQAPSVNYGNPNGAGLEDEGAVEQTGPGAATTRQQVTRPGIPSVRVPGGTPTPQQTAREPERAPASRTSDKPVIQPIIRPQDTATSSGSTSASPIRPVIEPVKTPQPAKNSEELGRELQRSGKYDEAITAYRDALNQTSDSGRVYQNIALSYQRKGDHDQAVENYNRAIKAYRDQLATGRNRAEVENGIRSCEAGIEVSRNRK